MNAYLTAAQVQLLKKSFRQLNAQAYSDYFYKNLFERHPEVRPMFPADIEELKLKLMSVFELVMFSFEEKQDGQFALQEPLIIPLRHLGRTHEEKGVLPAHYQIANGLTLESLAHTLGTEHTPEIRQAWQLALAHLTSAMLNKSVQIPDRIKNDSGATFREAFGQVFKKIKGYAR
jgi:hemoglobin-like flavoprotein